MTTQDALYAKAGEQFAPAIARLARAMERDPERARDLEQDIHCAIWKSLDRFEGRSSLKTWVFRVAHNTAADFVRSASKRPKPVQVEDFDSLPMAGDAEHAAAENHALAKVMELVRELDPLDAQIILLWLEGETGTDIAEITGLSTNAANVRIHRLKERIAQSFQPASARPSVETSEPEVSSHAR